MKVVALVESESHVCCRYRVAAFRPALAAAGWNLTIRSLPKSPVGRMRVYREIRTFDAVILLRKLISVVEMAVLRRYARKLIYDFDDAVWGRDSFSKKGFDAPKRARRFRNTIRSADAVVAGNDYLAEEAHRHTDCSNVTVVPTCVAPRNYPLARHSGTGPVRLVWVGSSSTLKALDRFRHVLEIIGREVPNVRLKLICDAFLTFDPLPVEPVRWTEAGEASSIADAEIGIAWMPDDDWSRGKCGLKVLQYQAAGLPVVANPVGVQGRFVQDDLTGFRAETASEWVSAIQRLACDPSLRQALGQAGRQQVEAEYSVEVGGRLWAEMLDAVVRVPRPVG